MREQFYRFLTFVSNWIGRWFFAWTARVIAAGYFVLFPGRTLTGIRFYGALYPERSRFYHIGCAWRQFQSFTSVFLDRYLLAQQGAIDFTFEGREHIYAALRQGSGGILLMTHMGNWEVGARLLRRSIPDLRLMLYMGQRGRDQIEKLQKSDLAESGIRIMAVDRDGASPLDLIEGVAFIKSGGFASMAGDLVWHRDQRTVPARMFGHTVRFPEAPFMLAMVSGAPLYIFFTRRTGPHRFHFSMSEPIPVTAGNRSQRRQAIARAAQIYADHIQRHLRRSPFEWYHFEPFLGAPAGAEHSNAA